MKKLMCWLFGHKINSYLIEHSKEKVCVRCGKKLWVWSIYTVDDYLTEKG